MLEGTKELKDVKIHWKLKTCESRAQYIEPWKSYRKSILRKLWNMLQHVEEFKSSKKVNSKNVQ